MSVDEIAAAVDAALAGDRTARIQQDAARVREMAEDGFEGPTYEKFKNDLCREVWPILLGMLRDGRLARIALKWCSERGRPFWVHPEDSALLRANPDARYELCVQVFMQAEKSFKRRALLKGGWNPDHTGRRGASCLTSYFLGQCIWEFRRAYTPWAKERHTRTKQQMLFSGSEDDAARTDPELFRLLMATNYASETEASKLSTDFEKVLKEQPPLTQAVIRMSLEAYADTEIADALRLTHGAVRMRKTRFRNALYAAARERRIWIPEQLHTNAGTRRRAPRGAA